MATHLRDQRIDEYENKQQQERRRCPTASGICKNTSVIHENASKMPQKATRKPESAEGGAGITGVTDAVSFREGRQPSILNGMPVHNCLSEDPSYPWAHHQQRAQWLSASTGRLSSEAYEPMPKNPTERDHKRDRVTR